MNLKDFAKAAFLFRGLVYSDRSIDFPRGARGLIFVESLLLVNTVMLIAACGQCGQLAGHTFKAPPTHEHLSRRPVRWPARVPGMPVAL